MIVLDTQVWLWWVHDDAQLSARAAQAIKQAEGTDGIRVSVISVWEIAVKSALGKAACPNHSHCAMSRGPRQPRPSPAGMATNTMSPSLGERVGRLSVRRAGFSWRPGSVHPRLS